MWAELVLHAALVSRNFLGHSRVACRLAIHNQAQLKHLWTIIHTVSNEKVAARAIYLFSSLSHWVSVCCAHWDLSLVLCSPLLSAGGRGSLVLSRWVDFILNTIYQRSNRMWRGVKQAQTIYGSNKKASLSTTTWLSIAASAEKQEHTWAWVWQRRYVLFQCISQSCTIWWYVFSFLKKIVLWCGGSSGKLWQVLMSFMTQKGFLKLVWVW